MVLMKIRLWALAAATAAGWICASVRRSKTISYESGGLVPNPLSEAALPSSTMCEYRIRGSLARNACTSATGALLLNTAVSTVPVSISSARIWSR